jgi:hypothetical protein
MPRTTNYRSRALSRAQVGAAIAAYEHAEAIERPLNLTLDVHWAWSRFATDGLWNRRKAIAGLLESQRHWLDYRDVTFMSILVREAPPSSNEGEHAHQLVHVPVGIRPAFLQHVRDYLRGNKRHQKKALSWDVPYNDGKLAYMLKGCTPAARDLIVAKLKTGYERGCFLESTSAKANQGIIYGKRLLISQSLGPQAQRGYVPLHDKSPDQQTASAIAA